MSTMGREQNASGVTVRECAAWRLLHADDVGIDELAFMFERQSETVRRHVRHHCAHGSPVARDDDLWAAAANTLDVGHVVVESQDPRRLEALAQKLQSLARRARAGGER